MMRGFQKKWIVPVFALGLACISCLTAEEEFAEGRLLDMCDESYWICRRAAGCVLDRDRYLEGAFPGAKRFVIETEQADVELHLRVFLTTMESAGTEMLLQAYEPDCTLDPRLSIENIKDQDIFELAGDRRTLHFHVYLARPGEHLIEIYSDAVAEYLIIYDQK